MKKLIILLIIPLISFGQEKINFDSKTSIRKNFDDNGAEHLEGIWEEFFTYEFPNITKKN